MRYVVFQDHQAWCAVALELNIVETGTDPREVLFSLMEAIQGSIQSAAKSGSWEVLCQRPDPEYERLWQALRTTGAQAGMAVYTFGERALAVA